MTLFLNGDGPALKRMRLGSVHAEIVALDPDYALNVDEDKLVSHIVAKYAESLPVVLFEQTEMESFTSELRVHDYGRQSTVAATIHRFRVPYTGDPKFFGLRAESFDTNPPEASVEQDALVVEFSEHGRTWEAVAREFSRFRTSVEKHLGWQRMLWGNLDAEIEAVARQALGKRRDEARALKRNSSAIADALGFKLIERKDEKKIFSAPVARKSIPPMPNAAEISRQPFLERKFYESVIGTIDGAGRSIERSASSLRGRDEESLRDILLVALNGQFENAAHGEAFNKAGKTDIVIRHDKGNLFIGECKIWRGAKEFAQAIDQLFGYMTWRDTKAALIVFNRNRDFSRVIEEMRKVAQAHLAFLDGPRATSESAFEVTFKNPSDADKKITVTVMAFDLGMDAVSE
jgi:hypothetical protein